MAPLRRMQDLKPQRAVESDSSRHFVALSCARDDPLDWKELFISLRRL